MLTLLHKRVSTSTDPGFNNAIHVLLMPGVRTLNILVPGHLNFYVSCINNIIGPGRCIVTESVQHVLPVK